MVPRHLDDPKGRRDLSGLRNVVDESIPRQAKIPHGPGDFSSRTRCLPGEKRGQALVEMTAVTTGPYPR
jgi:hypothetical protein